MRPQIRQGHAPKLNGLSQGKKPPDAPGIAPTPQTGDRYFEGSCRASAGTEPYVFRDKLCGEATALHAHRYVTFPVLRCIS